MSGISAPREELINVRSTATSGLGQEEKVKMKPKMVMSAYINPARPPKLAASGLKR